MALPGEIGWIGKDCPDHRGTKLQTKIKSSNAGYFIGTRCPDCFEPHFSRESHYYESRESLVAAVEAGNVRWRDTNFRPDVLELLQFMAEIK